MHRVVLEHIGQVVRLEQVVDGNDLDVAEVLHGGAQHIAADAAKTVDADLDQVILMGIDEWKGRKRRPALPSIGDAPQRAD
jgi:hypothetical protein